MSTASEAIAIAANDPSTPYGKACPAARAAVAESPAERAARLESELTAAQATLDAAMAPLRRGERSAADFGAIAERISALQKELAEAQSAASEADDAARRAQRAELERQFEQSAAKARELREEFRRSYADSVRTLGRFCAAVKDAIAARNALTVGLADPLRDAPLRELTSPKALDVLCEMRDAGYEPVLDFGWDFNFSISALRRKE